MSNLKNKRDKLVSAPLFLKLMALKPARKLFQRLSKAVVKKLLLVLLHLKCRIRAIMVKVNSLLSTFRLTNLKRVSKHVKNYSRGKKKK